MLPSAQNCFGVAGCPPWPIINSIQFGSHVEVIVNFSVKDDSVAVIFGKHGLVPARQVDDRQSAKSESAVSIDVHAFVIGPAMADAVDHFLDRSISRTATDLVDESGNSAHT